jgi:hypothetical protein
MILTFLAYDWFVQRRNQMVVGAAARATEFCQLSFPRTFGIAYSKNENWKKREQNNRSEKASV